MSDSMNVLPRTRSHLGLHDFLPGWLSLVGEKIGIQRKSLCSFRCDGKLCGGYGLCGFFMICFGNG